MKNILSLCLGGLIALVAYIILYPFILKAMIWCESIWSKCLIMIIPCALWIFAYMVMNKQVPPRSENGPLDEGL